jgi:malate permease and related proteins
VIDSLTDIYLPLVGWTLAGLLFFRFLPEAVPRFMGRSLYWVGVPLQVLAFIQRADLTRSVWLVPAVVAFAFFVGLGAGWLWAHFTGITREQRGGFLLSSSLGNVGFVGLAIAPYLVDDAYLGWVVLFSLAHNVICSYGLGVAIASYYGEHNWPIHWSTHIRSMLVTPSIWACAIGIWLKLQHIELAEPIAIGIQASVQIVIPMALLLIGIRLSQIKKWDGVSKAIPAVLIKLVLVPLCVGGGLTLLGVPDMPRLAMVLQAGMPCAFAGAILAEEYNVQEETILLSIALSSVGILVTIPLWLWLF